MDAQRQVATCLYENDRLQGKVPRAIPEPRTDDLTGNAVCPTGEAVPGVANVWLTTEPLVFPSLSQVITANLVDVKYYEDMVAQNDKLRVLARYVSWVSGALRGRLHSCPQLWSNTGS